MGESLQERVSRALSGEIAAAFQMDGTSLEVLDVLDGVARVRLNGACGCCPSSSMGVIMGIEQELRRLVPEVEYLEVAP